MEKKKLQRIIGISVVVAFVIVLIPFLFGKRELQQQETAKVVIPVTTNDANQTAVVENTNAPSADNMNVQNAEDNGITPVATAPIASSDQSNAPVAAVSPSVDTTTNPSAAPSEPMNAAAPNTNAVGESTAMTNQPVNPSNPQSPSAMATPVPAPTPNVAPAADTTAPADDNTVEMTPAVVTETDTTAHPQATAVQVATQQHTTHEVVKPKHLHKNVMAKKASHFSSKNLTTMKKSAWVVQMGSFKNQSNAHRLVDQLKGSGFKAFTHVVTSPAGAVRTRVYIGPEMKEASAKKLSTKVAQEVKLQGFVVPL